MEVREATLQDLQGTTVGSDGGDANEVNGHRWQSKARGMK